MSISSLPLAPGTKVRMFASAYHKNHYGVVVTAMEANVVSTADWYSKWRPNGVLIQEVDNRVSYWNVDLVMPLPICPGCDDNQVEPDDYLCEECRRFA